MKYQRYQLLVLAIFALGAFFRFSHLGTKLYSHDEAYTSIHGAGYTGGEAIDTIWIGEVITRDDIRHFLQPGEGRGLSVMLSKLARSEPQASPLYYVFSYYWMRLVGFSPAAMRGLPALISLFSLPTMFWFCREIFKSRPKALLSMALLALSPFNILYAQDARPYSLLALLTLLSSAIFLKAIRRNTRMIWAGYAVSLAIGLYAHILFALIAVAHGGCFLVVKEWLAARKFLRYLASTGFALIVFTPWLYQVYNNWNQLTGSLEWTRVASPWIQYFQRWVVIFSSPFIDLQFNSSNLIPYIMRGVVLLMLGYALYYIIISTPRQVWAFLLLLIGSTTLPFILSDLLRGGVVSIQGRYFASVNILTVPVMAHLLVEKISIPQTSHSVKWILITVFLLAAMLGSVVNSYGADTWWIKNLSLNSPQVVQTLNQASQPLMIVDGKAPTELGDVLALSLMVDKDVSFLLYTRDAVVEMPSGYSEIYWFRQTFWPFLGTKPGRKYTAVEVVPNRLWRMDKIGGN